MYCHVREPFSTVFTRITPQMTFGSFPISVFKNTFYGNTYRSQIVITVANFEIYALIPLHFTMSLLIGF